MRLEAARDKELNKRKGLAWRTVVGFIWLASITVGAYYLTGWLFENQIISINFFYGNLYIPPTVEPQTIRLGLALVIVIAIQFFILIGYGMASPVGRSRPGKATAYTKDPDPLDNYYYR